MKRVEDWRLLRGRGRYLDDLRFPAPLHSAFLRSPHAHARIRALELGRARAMAGVVSVFDGAEIHRWCRPIRAVVTAPGFIASDCPVLARDKVRFVGEAVALVVAESRYAAADAVDAVAVDYEPLAPVVDAATAMAAEAPLLHEEAGTNVLYRHHLESPGVAAAFENADLVLTAAFETPRATGVPIEPRGCVAEFDRATERLTLWSSTQVPHILRTVLAELLEMDESRIRVAAPDVGGGFGVKGQLYPEEVAVCVAARVLGRPVKWVEDRRESFLASIHAREHRYEVEAAVQRDGRIAGLRARVVVDCGAYSIYPYTVATEPAHAASLLPGPYDFQPYACDAFGVVTNKCPTAPYRGVSRPSANFVTERLIDMIARRLDLDPMEVRFCNLIRDDQFPYRTAAGVVFDSGRYGTAVRRALESVDYARFRPEQKDAWRQNRYLGVGLSIYVETSAGGSWSFKRRGMPVAGFDMSLVRVLPTAKVEVFTSAASQGQSHETVFGQLVADTLGMPLERVTVAEGDTQLVAYGTGTFGSRSAVMAGGATLLAARRVRDRALRVAAHLLEAAPPDVVLEDGRFTVRGAEARTVRWEDVARAAYLGTSQLPADLGPGLEATASYDLPVDHLPCSYGVHSAVVEVDPETGRFAIRKYVIVEDCGTMLNPVVVEGQLHGALAQGIGTASGEVLVYDQGGQLLTASLMDYPVPTAAQVPPVEIHHLVTPSPYTLTGAKGMAEGAAVAPPAMLANAICDALRPFGVEIMALPLTAERVRGAILAAATAGAAPRP
ncbi:MAG: xanthine dehydrogenase family protein [Elusimicrobia bacterium]|nr:xanthine dehydrogenase family protein [Elusimicrobiota bacterium]